MNYSQSKYIQYLGDKTISIWYIESGLNLIEKDDVIFIPDRIINPVGIHEEIYCISSDSCSICYEENSDCRIICNHTFHITCIDKWIDRNPSCPLCRTNVYDICCWYDKHYELPKPTFYMKTVKYLKNCF